MGFFDSIVGQVAGAALGGGGGGSQNVLGGLTALLGNSQTGGLGGLLAQLSHGGLGEQVKSWVGTGPNMPVSGAQITGALEGPMLQQIAERTGLPAGALGPLLAQMLPSVINHLTPHGTVPSHEEVQQNVAGLAQVVGDQGTDQ